ncbi:MAG: OmpA family protein [Pseudodesulfovibrio sp.]
MSLPPSFTPRRPRREDSGWQLTLADMMTLILCFFVILVSVAKVDPARYEAVSGILAEAMKGADAPSRRAAEIPSSPEDKKQRNLFELQLELARLVGRESGAATLKLRPDAVAIDLRGGVFFKLGSADLTGEALTILDKLAGPLTSARYDLTVEGHSDNLPIKSSQFPSNWELSSARASSVARYLIAQGFPRDAIRVMGLADTRPLAPNEDAAGNPLPDNQARNRRVVILVRPAKG